MCNVLEHLGIEGGQIFDPLCVAAVIEPQVLTSRPMWVGIELQGALTRGARCCVPARGGSPMWTGDRRTFSAP